MPNASQTLKTLYNRQKSTKLNIDKKNGVRKQIKEIMYAKHNTAFMSKISFHIIKFTSTCKTQFG